MDLNPMVCFDNSRKSFLRLGSGSLIRGLSIVCFLALFALACSGRGGAEITGFDNTSWKADPNGCKGQRLLLMNDLEGNLEQLKGLKNREVMQMLGKPDRNELYKRSQKFFIYYISTAEACENYDGDTSTVYLSIRFNALGLSNEAIIYK